MSWRDSKELNAEMYCECCHLYEQRPYAADGLCGECAGHGVEPCTVVTDLGIVKRALACLNYMPRKRIPSLENMTSYDVAAQLDKLIKRMEDDED